MTTATLNIAERHLQPFGVELNGFNAISATDDEVARLSSLLGECGFVVLRKQSISDEAFSSLLARLGPMMFTEGETAIDGFPMLNCVSNVGRKTSPKSVFHSDTSYVDQPPAFTALRPVTIPQAGGETLISDQYTAYETLPEGFKRALRETRALHVATGVPIDEIGQSECWHPLFRRQ